MNCDEITVHGLKSSFRDWAPERTNTPRAVVEAALAHTVKDKVEAGYFRSDLFELRRALMQERASLRQRRGSPNQTPEGGVRGTRLYTEDRAMLRTCPPLISASAPVPRTRGRSEFLPLMHEFVDRLSPDDIRNVSTFFAGPDSEQLTP